jgi:hypothetical protein
MTDPKITTSDAEVRLWLVREKINGAYDVCESARPPIRPGQAWRLDGVPSGDNKWWSDAGKDVPIIDGAVFGVMLAPGDGPIDVTDRVASSERVAVLPRVCPTCGSKNLSPDHGGLYRDYVDLDGTPWLCDDCRGDVSPVLPRDRVTSEVARALRHLGAANATLIDSLALCRGVEAHREDEGEAERCSGFVLSATFALRRLVEYLTDEDADVTIRRIGGCS